MKRETQLKPEYIFLVHLIGVVIIYGHSYWKFKPCETERDKKDGAQ